MDRCESSWNTDLIMKLKMLRGLTYTLIRFQMKQLEKSARSVEGIYVFTGDPYKEQPRICTISSNRFATRVRIE